MLSFAMDSTFVVTYFTMIGSLLVLTTISYDTFDNGMPFLMSLPVSGKTYAQEKFLFSLIGLFVSWGTGVVVHFITSSFSKRSLTFSTCWAWTSLSSRSS